MLDGAAAVDLLEVQRVALQVQLKEDVAVLHAGLRHHHKTNMMECVCVCVFRYHVEAVQQGERSQLGVLQQEVVGQV